MRLWYLHVNEYTLPQHSRQLLYKLKHRKLCQYMHKEDELEVFSEDIPRTVYGIKEPQGVFVCYFNSFQCRDVMNVFTYNLLSVYMVCMESGVCFREADTCMLYPSMESPLFTTRECHYLHEGDRD